MTRGKHQRAMWRRTALWVAVMGLAAVTAPAASASIGPLSMSLSPASATAGSTASLGTDIKFSPSGGDSAKDLTLTLPPGLLANASLDGGACLKSATPTAACQVGSGTVSATVNALGGLPVGPLQLSAAFYLVAPANRSQLAGLAVVVNDPISGPTQLGSPAAVTIRPSTDPGGVGLDISFANIPNSFDGQAIELDEINSTFSAMRFPDSCPSTPAHVTVTADSYADASPTTATAPLTVTGCGALPYAPGFAVSVTKDIADDGVALTTDVTQTAGQATNRSVSLAFPTNALVPNVEVIGALCADPASGTCTPVGRVTTVSPLYPAPLVGGAYLTGSLAAPTLTLMFGAPFSLTLTGQVDLAKNATTFTGLPDFPLSDLKVALNGGSTSVFSATCRPPSGTATATLVSQNGDQTKQVGAPFTISPCVLAGRGHHSHAGKPRIDRVSASGLAAGRPLLVFELVAGRNAGKLRLLTVSPPRGLQLTGRRTGRRLAGLSLTGGAVTSARLRRGRLVIALRRPAGRVVVGLSGRALAEARSLRTRARRHRLKSLGLTVAVKDSRGTQTTLHVQIRKLHLRAALGR
jgi:hypothetical protein